MRMNEDSCVKKCRSLKVNGTHRGERPRKTQGEVARTDLRILGPHGGNNKWLRCLVIWSPRKDTNMSVKLSSRSDVSHPYLKKLFTHSTTTNQTMSLNLFLTFLLYALFLPPTPQSCSLSLCHYHCSLQVPDLWVLPTYNISLYYCYLIAALNQVFHPHTRKLFT